MKARITPCGRFIQMTDYTQLEYEQMQHSFKKRISAWRWHPLCKKKIWDGYIKFIDKYNRIPIGLWHQLGKICQEHNLELNFNGIEHVKNLDFKESEFIDWVWDFYDGTRYGKGGERELREYQIKACIDTIRYYKSRSELATSAGKTIIMFTIFAYMHEKELADKHLIVVPNTSLVIQTYEGFLEYAEGTRLEKTLKIQMIGGGRDTSKKDVDIVIGTYQTLKNLDDEFYHDFECVAVDECLHPESIITMGDGSKKKITEINIGDKVKTVNENTMKVEIKEVDTIYRNLSKGNQMYEIETENGKTLKLTGNHKVLLRNGEYKRVDELSLDDDIEVI